MNAIVESVESKYLKTEVARVRVGDTVRASLKVKEGNRERTQVYEGVVIAIDGGGIARSVKIRKISFSVGVEKTIPLHSPTLQKLEVVKEGKPRRSKLYYLRGRVGKAAVKVKPRHRQIGKKQAKKIAGKNTNSKAQVAKAGGETQQGK